MGEVREKHQRFQLKLQCVDNGNVNDTIGRLKAKLGTIEGARVASVDFVHPSELDAKEVMITIVLSFDPPVGADRATEEIRRQIEAIESPEPIIEGYDVEAVPGDSPGRGA